jgi:uncharacterized protein with von Willebrand factor type A (vWA) domain
VTLNAIAALCADTTFQGQIRAAAVSYAHTAMTASHTIHGAADVKTYGLAISTIEDGCTANLTRFVWGIATTPGFSAVVNDTTNTNDAAINSAMVSQWATIAGVTGADLGN